MEKPPTPRGGGDVANYKVKLMCSYGGKIQPQPHDHQLTYVGGDTKLMTVDRKHKFNDVVGKLNSLLNFDVEGLCLKYQLPGVGLDLLVSVFDDDDVENMMVEYDRIHRISTKPARIRLFLFGPNDRIMSKSVLPPPATLIPDFLFGFDKEYEIGWTGSNRVQPDNIGSNTGNGAEGPSQNQTKIQGIVGVGSVRENHVTSAGYATASGSFVPAAQRTVQLFYPIPPAVPVGYGAGYGQYRPVYNFVPAMTSVPDQKNRHVVYVHGTPVTGNGNENGNGTRNGSGGVDIESSNNEANNNN